MVYHLPVYPPLNHNHKNLYCVYYMVPAHLRHSMVYQSGIRVTYRPRLKYGLFAEEITIVVFVLADPQSNVVMEENRSRFYRSTSSELNNNWHI